MDNAYQNMWLTTLVTPLIGTYSMIQRHELNRDCGFDLPIVNFFSSVAYVWVPGAKTTGPIAKKFGFS
jgi:hypothetical protein